MAEHTAEKLDVQPYFDVELLMNTSQETRIGGEVMNRLMQRWEAWMDKLHALHISTGKIQYLVVWLDSDVEEDVDAAWESSPSDAFIVNSLAQTMVMSAVHMLLPEVEDVGCAPAPKPTDKLRAALEAEGLPYNGDGPTLSRRYAVVTHYPFKGGCEICTLLKDCPKGSGAAGAPSSIVLPGYEPGTE